MTNESLVGRAIKGHRDEYVIATKFARRIERTTQPGDMSTIGPLDGSPAHVRTSIEGSLQRLGTDHVDLYYQHRVDPRRPHRRDGGRDGRARAAGQDSPHRSERGRAGHDPPGSGRAPDHGGADRVFAVDARPEVEIIPTCRELGIGFVPYSPLGRGFLSGRFKSPDELDEGDFRRSGPRFTGENLQANLKLAEKVAEIAGEKDVTPAQLALAWVLSRGEDLVPIPGTKRRKYLEENAAAVDVELTGDDLERIENDLPSVSGDRYDKAGMASVNL